MPTHERALKTGRSKHGKHARDAGPHRRRLVAFLLALVCSLAASAFTMPTNMAFGTEYNIGQNSGWVNTEKSSLTIDNKPYSDGMSVNYGDSVNFKLSWSVPNSVNIHIGDTFVYDLPEGIDFNAVSGVTVYDDDGNAVGKLNVENGKVVVTVTAALGKNVTAYVDLTGTVNNNATGGENGGQASFVFPGYGEIGFYVTPVHGLQASKSGAVSTDDNSVFYFVVDVTSTGTNTNVKIEDSMGDLLTLLNDPSIAIYTDADLTQPYTGAWYVANQDNHAFNLNINSMGDGQTLYIKYCVQIDRNDVTAVTKSYQHYDRIRNTVTYYSEETTTKQQTAKELWLDSNWSVSKSGSVQGTNTINWKIIVAPPSDAQVDAATTVKDVLGANQNYDANATVTITSRHQRWWDATPDVTTCTLAELMAGTVQLPLLTEHTPYPEYEITYAVTVTEDSLPEAGSGDKTVYSNSATVTPGDSSNAVTTTGTVTIGKDAVSLSKSYVGSVLETQQLPWVIAMKAEDDLPAGKTLTDTVGVDAAGNARGSQQQYFDGNTDVKIYTNADLTTEYTGNFIWQVADDQRSLTVTFNDAIPAGTTLYLSYPTYVNGTVDNGAYFVNTVEMLRKSVTAQFQPVSDNMTKSQLYYYNRWNITGKDTTGLMSWELWIHDVAQNATSVTVTDTLPRGLVYVNGSATAYGPHSGNNLTTYDGLTVTENIDGTITFALAAGSEAWNHAQTSNGLYVVYDTAFDYDTVPSGSSQFSNSAVINVSGVDQQPDTAGVWASVPKAVSKSSTYDAATAPYVEYTVKVNTAGSTLNNGKTLTLSDTLGKSLELRMDSVEIANANTGAQIVSASYAYDPVTKAITFKVPDATPIIISYKTLVVLAPGASFANLGSNTVSLQGMSDDYGKASTKESGEAKAPMAGIQSDTNMLQIYKYADGDTTKPLNGAVFTVEELKVTKSADGKTWTVTGADTVTSALTSGLNGYTSSVSLLPDTIYRITETAAPEGYCAVEVKADNTCSEATQVMYLVYPGKEGDGYKNYSGITVIDDRKSVNVTQAVIESNGSNVTVQTYLWSVSNPGKTKASFTLYKTDSASSPLPGAIFELTKDGDTSFKKQEWDSAKDNNSTSHTFTELSAGTYTLTETKVPDGYIAVNPITIEVTEAGNVIANGRALTTEENATDTKQFALTVANEPLTTTVTATKVWDDNNNQDGARNTITFTLQRSKDGGDWKDVDGQSKIIKPNGSDSGLTVQWTNLPIKDGTADLSYRVIETMLESTGFEYTTNKVCVDGDGKTADRTVDVATLKCTFTNTHTPKTTNVPVTKVWDDDNNADELRPDQVVVELLANGEVTDQTLTLSAENNWQGSFANLPQYNDGVEIVYTVREVNVPTGYTATVSVVENGAMTVKNSHHSKNDQIVISKVDVGGNQLAGAELTVTGTRANGETIDPMSWMTSNEPELLDLTPGEYVLTETKTPTGYQTADPITFRVIDNGDGKRSVIVAGQVVENNTVTMTDYFNTTSVKVRKVSGTDGVNEIAGAKLTLTGTTLAGEVISRNWESTESPRELTLVPGQYRLHESAAPDGYEVADDIVFTVTVNGTIVMNGNEQESTTIMMNDLPGTTNVTISKIALGGSSELSGATFELTGTTFEHSDVNVTWESGISSSSTSTLCSTDSMPTVCSLQDGEYTLVETEAPAGYDRNTQPVSFTIAKGQVIINGTVQNGNVITVVNAEKQYTAMSVIKRWEDSRNKDRHRQNVTVQAVLYCNGALCQSDDAKVELNDQNNWTHDWLNLPVYDQDGNAISYSVNEELGGDSKDKYHNAIYQRTSVNGLTTIIYNIHTPDAREIAVTKVWDDQDNQDGIRPAMINVTVYGSAKCIVGGTEEDCVETLVTTALRESNATIDDDGQWTWTIENLPAKNAYGNDYSYTVVESPVAYYNGYDKDGQCTRNESCEPSVEEVKDGGILTGVTFTNTHQPQTIEVEVRKVWDDLNNHNNTRPQSITVWLLSSVWENSNGWPLVQSNAVSDRTGLWVDSKTVTWPAGYADGDCVDTPVSKVVGVSCLVLTAKDAVDDNTWVATFTNVPKYHDGTIIRYSLTEQIDDLSSVTATYTPSFTDLTGTVITNEDNSNSATDSTAHETDEPDSTETDGDSTTTEDRTTDENDSHSTETITTLGSADHLVMQLTNTYEPEFSLPSAGGSGLPIWLSAVGVVALALAAMLGMSLNTRKPSTHDLKTKCVSSAAQS